MRNYTAPKTPRRPLSLVDPALISNWAEPDPADDTPGACLPADFPRAGLSADKLIELEEWYLSKTRVAILRLFSLIHTTRDGGNPTATSVLYCVAILAKLLAYHEHATWKELAEQLGTNQQALCLLRTAVAHKMASFMGSPTPAEYKKTARVLARQARKHSLLASILAQ
jgi:hypothetical protein